MPLETQANAVTLSPAKGVDVDKIEKELASMWANNSEASSSGSGLTRACALNLIVYTTPWDDRSQLEDLLSEVNERHPGRTLILVAYRETAEARLDAYVSMRCRLLGQSGKQICGEQVTIEAGGALVETAATAVEPLLVPDVPVYLWWKDIPHYNDKLFDRLSRMADRMVIDSAAFDHPYEDLLRLAGAISDLTRAVHVSDLNWGRLTSWRTLLASFWDVPEYRPLLNAIDRVAIEYRPAANESDAVTAQALLLAGWLASRLNWEGGAKATSDSKDTTDCELRSGDRSLTVSLVRDQTSTQTDGLISSVVLTANAGEATFSIVRPAGGATLATEARLGDKHSVGRVLAYEVRSEAERLSRELAFTSRDAIYEAAITKSAQLVAAISQK